MLAGIGALIRHFAEVCWSIRMLSFVSRVIFMLYKFKQGSNAIYCEGETNKYACIYREGKRKEFEVRRSILEAAFPGDSEKFNRSSESRP